MNIRMTGTLFFLACDACVYRAGLNSTLFHLPCLLFGLATLKLCKKHIGLFCIENYCQWTTSRPDYLFPCRRETQSLAWDRYGSLAVC